MTSNLRHARGVTLIEMMVAVLVLSIGLLGIAGMQAATSKYKINSWSRSQASVLLSDLAERVRINPGAGGTNFSANAFACSWTNGPFMRMRACGANVLTGRTAHEFSVSGWSNASSIGSRTFRLLNR